MAGERILVIDDSQTILALLQLILSQDGYQTITASDGREGLERARSHNPDLILLDYVMPEIDGIQVLKALAAHEYLNRIPVILLCSRGNDTAEKVKQAAEGAQFLPKPFTPEKIRSVVAMTLAHHKEEEAEREDSPFLSWDEALNNRGAAGLAGLPGELRGAIAGAMADIMVNSYLECKTDSEARARMISSLEEALASEALADILDMTIEELGRMRKGEDVALNGELSLIKLSDIMYMLQSQHSFGVLSVFRGGQRVEIFFREGRVDWVQGTNMQEEFLLGRYFVDQGLISEHDLDLLLKSRTGSKKLIGNQILKLGYATEEELRKALKNRSIDLMFEVFRWREGHFNFRILREWPSQAEEASLALEIDELVMGGLRRIDEWDIIENEVNSLHIIPALNKNKNEYFQHEKLTNEENKILNLVDGRKNIQDIITESRMASFDVCKLLFRLISLQLVRKKVTPFKSK